MINAKDLMIDNWIAGPDGKPYQVTALEIAIKVEGQKKDRWMINGNPEELCFPLPLTPELMKKMGWEFDPVPNGVRWNDPSQMLTHKPFRDRNHVKIWGEDYQRGYFSAKPGDVAFYDGFEFRPCTFLHELQNMYRWETDKHLEVSI